MDPHRVRRLRWQARAASPADAFALRSLLREDGDACQVALERAFDNIGASPEVLHLPRLALTIQATDLQSLRGGGLADRVEAALRSALAAAAPGAVARVRAGSGADGVAATGAGRVPSTASAVAAGAAESSWRQSPAAARRQALQHYLSTGLLPWTLAGLVPEQAHRALREAAAQAAGAIASGAESLDTMLPASGTGVRARIGALLRCLPLLPAALRRQWIAAHPWPPPADAQAVQAWRDWIDADADDRIEWQAIWLAGPLPASELQELIAALHRAGHGEPPFVAGLRAGLAAKAGRPLAVDAAVDEAPPASHRARSTGTAVTASPAQGADVADGAAAAGSAPSLLVPLAGLVLLHPWLPRLLAACGVLDEGGKEVEATQLPRACAVLHALACGDAPVFEHQLPFVKLLLGRPPDGPLDAMLPALAPADQEEIAALIAAVREHWSALQGTGSDGLRLSFLQRRGLLSRGDGVWQLRMQGESFDLLLGLLPWSIGLVRLPWMREPLVVDWPLP